MGAINDRGQAQEPARSRLDIPPNPVDRLRSDSAGRLRSFDFLGP